MKIVTYFYSSDEPADACDTWSFQHLVISVSLVFHFAIDRKLLQVRVLSVANDFLDTGFGYFFFELLQHLLAILLISTLFH